jgi:flagellin
MGLLINTSYNSLWNIYNLNSTLAATALSMEKLSSGLRINRAADDPAGLVISEQMLTQIGSLNQQIKNVTAAINKYETVSSTVGTLRSSLTELRSLAVGAANEAVNSPGAVQAYQDAADAIVNTYNTIADNAEYNGAKTLDGSEGSLAEITQLANLDFSSAEAAEQSIETIEAAIDELDAAQIELGATQKNELESELANLQVTRQNLVAAESQLRDLDYAAEYSNLVSNMIRTQATVAMITHQKLIGSQILSLIGS